MALIVCEQLHLTYGLESDVPIEALHGIDLTIDEGEFVAVVGRNGSGKSTLARCLNGLLRPTSGRVLVNGLDTALRQHRLTIRSTVGMVFQNPDNQFVMSTVREEVAFGPENLGVPRPELIERVDRALRLTGLADLPDVDPQHLSAGGKSRLAIAAMLALAPRCLVLDETTALMDPLARRETLALAQELCRQGLTIVWVTHHMDEVAEAARVVALDHGLLGYDGTPHALFADRALCAKLGLDLPPAAQVAHGLIDRGLSLDTLPLNAAELVDSLARAWEGRS
ncbi:MAG: ATP-binding cassette domain-containing protein [Anaerolineales bacterium]